MKLISFNVNGIRAIVKKSFVADIENLEADVVCLQETKATPEQVREALAELLFSGYQIYANAADKAGYSGTAILTKIQPLSISYDMPDHNTEGRIITAEYNNFYLVNVYTPNSGAELARLNYRVGWDADFFTYLKSLEAKKPVLVCGDLNVAHRPIDLTHPAANYNKSAGYMQDEIDGIDRYLAGGFADTFRYFHPERKEAYSWWSYRAGARPKNVGWRIDYFLCSESFLAKLKGATIFSEVYGSDHCPVGLEVED